MNLALIRAAIVSKICYNYICYNYITSVRGSKWNYMTPPPKFARMSCWN